MHKNILKSVAVIGGGSWATALVKVLSEKSIHINWWIRNPKNIQHIITYKFNPHYLSGISINTKKITLSTNLSQVFSNSSFILLVLPSAFIKETLSTLPDIKILKEKVIISAIKGMIPSENILITDYLKQNLKINEDRIIILGGPCHAEEVAMKKQTYITLTSSKSSLAKEYKKLFENRFIQVRINTDMYGIELIAVLKNIVAIACGIAHGLGYGDNFQAVLVANAMQEIQNFIQKTHPAAQRNIHISAYLGDVLVTTYSQFSRNRIFGSMIGKGYSIKSAQMQIQMITEGYYAVKSIYTINKKYQISIPIIITVYRILYENAPPDIEFKMLQGHLF